MFVIKREPLRGISFKNNPTQLLLVENTISHFQDVVSRHGFHLLYDIIHVFDFLAHDEGTRRAQQLVHAAFVAQCHLPDELLLGMMQL